MTIHPLSETQVDAIVAELELAPADERCVRELLARRTDRAPKKIAIQLESDRWDVARIGVVAAVVDRCVQLPAVIAERYPSGGTVDRDAMRGLLLISADDDMGSPDYECIDDVLDDGSDQELLVIADEYPRRGRFACGFVYEGSRSKF